jgi:hypothetical protein
MFEFIGAILGGLIFIGFLLFCVVVWCECRDRDGY